MKDTKEMSTIHETLIIMPPVHLVHANQVERFYGQQVECTYCQGKGIFESEGSRDFIKKEVCPVCGGSGQIRAKILIEWEGVSSSPA